MFEKLINIFTAILLTVYSILLIIDIFLDIDIVDSEFQTSIIIYMITVIYYKIITKEI